MGLSRELKAWTQAVGHGFFLGPILAELLFSLPFLHFLPHLQNGALSEIPYTRIFSMGRYFR